MDDPLLNVKKYLAAIGRRGGAKSKRKLSKREARRIASAGWEGAVGEARRAKLRAKTRIKWKAPNAPLGTIEPEKAY